MNVVILNHYAQRKITHSPASDKLSSSVNLVTLQHTTASGMSSNLRHLLLGAFSSESFHKKSSLQTSSGTWKQSKSVSDWERAETLDNRVALKTKKKYLHDTY